MEPGDIRTIREKLGLSQAELATLVGFSVRAIQSCEQGWRQPSPALEKMVLLLYIAETQGARFGSERCWEVQPCPPETREACITYRTRQGHLCWFLTGTLCRGQRMAGWGQKRARCTACAFFQRLMSPPSDHGPAQHE